MRDGCSVNETISTQLTLRRERFCPRDRRTVAAARRFAREALDDWGLGERGAPGKAVWCEFESVQDDMMKRREKPDAVDQ